MKTCDDYESYQEPQQPTSVCFHCGHTEQEHYPDVTPRNCEACGYHIPLARLEVLSNTIYCKNCVDNHGPKKVYDPETVCSKASQSSQNGFSRSD